MASVNKICEEHGIDLDDESDAPASQTTRNDLFFDEIEEGFDLQDVIGIFASMLIFSNHACTVSYFLDTDSDEELMDNDRSKRRPKKNIEKLNVKGETALHRACIKQDIALVRLLLQQVCHYFKNKYVEVFNIVVFRNIKSTFVITVDGLLYMKPAITEMLKSFDY